MVSGHIFHHLGLGEGGGKKETAPTLPSLGPSEALRSALPPQRPHTGPFLRDLNPIRPWTSPPPPQAALTPLAHDGCSGYQSTHRETEAREGEATGWRSPGKLGFAPLRSPTCSAHSLAQSAPQRSAGGTHLSGQETEPGGLTQLPKSAASKQLWAGSPEFSPPRAQCSSLHPSPTVLSRLPPSKPRNRLTRAAGRKPTGLGGEAQQGGQEQLWSPRTGIQPRRT